MRANRTFNWQTKRLTLFVEVMNVLGRENVRFEQPGINIRTGQAFGIFSSMIPLVPSAGVLIEFYVTGRPEGLRSYDMLVLVAQAFGLLITDRPETRREGRRWSRAWS